MAYRFKKSGKPADEVLRVAKKRIQHAVNALERYPDADVEGLHTARKDIKKVRSLLRLLRLPGFRNTRQSLNQQLRGTAAHLSAHRDQEVLANLLEKWLILSEVRHDPPLYAAVSTLSDFLKSAGTTHPPLEPAVERSAIDNLRQVADAIGKAELGEVSWKLIQRSARKRVRRMKQAREAYRENPTADSLHQWRKQVKNHTFNLCLLKQIQPVEKGRRQAVTRLEKHLGKARDLDLLLTYLNEAESLPIGIQELGRLLAFAGSRREAILQGQCNPDDQVTVP